MTVSSSMLNRQEGKKEAHQAIALYNYLLERESFRNLIRRIPVPVAGAVADEKVRAAFQPRKGTWSPTRLEEYAECPYRYFSHQLLNLESQSEGIDIRRKGTILHDVLEKFFVWRRDERGGCVEIAEALDYAMKRFDELWNEEPLTGDQFYKIELERCGMREMIAEILRLELVEKKPPVSGLVPAHFEYQFTGLQVKGEKRSFCLTGKIDRIDVDPAGQYALVIDYKTGKTFKKKTLVNGTSLQLPFYLIAIEKELGLKPLGGQLYSLSKGKSSGFHHQENIKAAGVEAPKRSRLSAPEFQEVISRAVRFAEKYVEGIEAAGIPVRPRDCVSWCPYSAVCRIEKWRLEHIYREIREEDAKAK